MNEKTELSYVKLQTLSDELVKLHNTLEGIRDDVDLWLIQMEQSLEELKK